MKNIIIYGIGRYGKYYVDKCISCSIKNITLTDSNSKLWGEKYQGFVIQNPDVVFAQNFDSVIISVSDKYKMDLYRHIKNNYNIADKKITYYDETVVLDKNEIYNMGNIELKEKINSSMIVTTREFYQMIKKEKFNKMESFFFERKHKTITKWLHYFEAYEYYFSKFRNRDVAILEIGVFKGGSLQMWRDYFQGINSNVEVYGIDINPDCKMLEEDNITIFIGSQEDRNFLKKIKEKIEKVDIIIDDGGHTMQQQIIAFEELFDLLNDGGIYLCEDTHTSYMKNFGGKYKGDTFVEYSKNLIDQLHAQYSETKDLVKNKYSEEIRSITYYDSMIFITKKQRTTKSIDIQIENK